GWLKKLRVEEPRRSDLGTMNVTQAFGLTASNRLLACRIRCRLSSRTTRQPKWQGYSVQPSHRVQQTPKLTVVYVQGGQPFAGSLKNDFVAFPAYCTECAVSVHKIKRIERVVYQLATGYEIEHGGYAEPDNHYREYDRDGVVDARRLRLLRRVFCAPNDGSR